jgi:hypothetical protein
MKVLVEGNAGGDWRRIGEIATTDPLGSMTIMLNGERNIVLFGWKDDQPGVWLSSVGVDYEVDRGRMVHSLGHDPLADLTEGPLELRRANDVIRFRLV